MDRTMWARFGEPTLKRCTPFKWLSGDGPQDTSTAEERGEVPGR
jgi:hypothetical protein